MKKISLIGVVVGLFGLVLLPFMSDNKDDTLKEKQSFVKTSDKKTEVYSKGVVKSVKNQKKSFLHHRKSKTIKSLGKGVLSAEDLLTVSKQKQIYDKNVQRAKLRQVAKMKYQRMQHLKAVQARANKSKQNFLAMQKILSSKNPNSFKKSPQFSKNKQIRDYVAYANYKKQQRKVTQMMRKTRARIEQQKRSSITN